MPDAWALAAPQLAIEERAVALSILRVHRDDAGSAGALGEAFGLAWPTVPNTVAEGALRVAWLAPGEWALFAAAAAVGERVGTACGGRLHHLAEVSAGRRLWRIEGARARDLIAKGCGLDTHPGVMPARSCARTGFAETPVLLLVGTAGQSFDLVADASFAGHLRGWFDAAAQEFLS